VVATGAPVKPPTNQHPTFYRPDVPLDVQPTAQSTPGRKYHSMTCSAQAHLGLVPSLSSLKAPNQASPGPSDSSTPG